MQSHIVRGPGNTMAKIKQQQACGEWRYGVLSNCTLHLSGLSERKGSANRLIKI